MDQPIYVLHFLNQFFAGLGGEESAGLPPQILDGPRGPGKLLEELGPNLSVVATLVAGDNYIAEDLETATQHTVAVVQEWLGRSGHKPDLFVAGPAFNAGRYGLACAALCQAMQDTIGVPAITAMHEDNPAVAMYRRTVPIVRAGADVLSMRETMTALANGAQKRARSLPLSPTEDQTLPSGARGNYFTAQTGAARALNLLEQKLKGSDWQTEYPMPHFDRVPPAPPVERMPEALVALVTSGGIVPRGNPDRIESASASSFGAYALDNLDRLDETTHSSVHGGYDPTFANQDPNRVLPLDALRELEREGRFGKLLNTYYATVGNSTSVNTAVRFGQEIAATLINVGVQAVILTST